MKNPLLSQNCPLFEKDIIVIVLPDDLKGMKEKEIEKDIHLVCHYIFKSLINWLQSPKPVEKLTENDWYTYDKCQLNHEQYWKCSDGMFYVMKAKDVWDLM
jgi:hypothetical protein